MAARHIDRDAGLGQLRQRLFRHPLVAQPKGYAPPMKNFLAQYPIPNSVTDTKPEREAGFSFLGPRSGRYPAIRRTLVHAKRGGDCQDKRANGPIAAHIADGAPLTSTLCNSVA